MRSGGQRIRRVVKPASKARATTITPMAKASLWSVVRGLADGMIGDVRW